MLVASIKPHWRTALGTRAALAIFIGLSTIAGLWGRFPWKADEPYSFGIAWNMVRTGQWVIPYVGNTPFVEKPPLVYWLGAAAIRLADIVTGLSPNIVLPPPHALVQLVTLGLSWASIGALVWTCATLASQGAPRCDAPSQQAGQDAALSPTGVACLLFVGAWGLIEHTHKFLADNGQLAGAAWGLAGLVRITFLSGARPGDMDRRIMPGTIAPLSSSNEGDQVRRPSCRAYAIAGLSFGSGMAIAFLSKGVMVPGILLCSLLLGLATLPALRCRGTAFACGWACLPFLPALLIWPLWFRHLAPDLFTEWLWVQNIGRFTGATQLGGNDRSLWQRLGALALASFPAGLILCTDLPSRVRGVLRGARAVFSSATGDPRKTGGAAPRLAPCGPWLARRVVQCYLAVSLAVVLSSQSMRSVYLMPTVLGIIILAACKTPSTHSLRWTAISRYLAYAIDSAVAMLLACTIGLFLMLTFGDVSYLPDRLIRGIGRHLPLPFALPLDIATILWVLAALAVLAAWRTLGPLLKGRPVLSAAAGSAVLWSCVGFLLMPWIDAARSYRTTFTDIAPWVSPHTAIASRGLGESERALFSYVTGIKLHSVHLGHSGSGDAARPNPIADRQDFLLVLTKQREPFVPDAAHWIARWSGSRAANRNELFTLYQRRTP